MRSPKHDQKRIGEQQRKYHDSRYRPHHPHRSVDQKPHEKGHFQHIHKPDMPSIHNNSVKIPSLLDFCAQSANDYVFQPSQTGEGAEEKGNRKATREDVKNNQAMVDHRNTGPSANTESYHAEFRNQSKGLLPLPNIPPAYMLNINPEAYQRRFSSVNDLQNEQKQTRDQGGFDGFDMEEPVTVPQAWQNRFEVLNEGRKDVNAANYAKSSTGIKRKEPPIQGYIPSPGQRSNIQPGRTGDISITLQGENRSVMEEPRSKITRWSHEPNQLPVKYPVPATQQAKRSFTYQKPGDVNHNLARTQGLNMQDRLNTSFPVMLTNPVQHNQAKLNTSIAAKKPPSICNICKIPYEDFSKHLKTQEHIMNSQHAMNRAKATEYLRKIEISSDKQSECNVCKVIYVGTWLEHKQSEEHKRKFRCVSRGCQLCKIAKFSVYPDYVKHIDSTSHKQFNLKKQWPKCLLCVKTFKSPKKLIMHLNTSAHMQKKRELNKNRTNQDTEGGESPACRPGASPAHSSSSITSPDISNPGAPMSSPDQETSCTEVQQIDTEKLQDDNDIFVQMVAKEDPIPIEENHISDLSAIKSDFQTTQSNANGLSTSPEKVAVPLHTSSPYPSKSQPSAVTQVEAAVILPPMMASENTGIPDASDINVVGTECIVPCSGWFCNICRKFFTTEEAAKKEHCAKRLHIEKYRERIMQLGECLDQKIYCMQKNVKIKAETDKEQNDAKTETDRSSH